VKGYWLATVDYLLDGQFDSGASQIHSDHQNGFRAARWGHRARLQINPAGRMNKKANRINDRWARKSNSDSWRRLGRAPQTIA